MNITDESSEIFLGTSIFTMLFALIIAVYAFVEYKRFEMLLPCSSLDKFALSLIGTILISTYFLVSSFSNPQDIVTFLFVQTACIILHFGGEVLTCIPILIQVNQFNEHLSGPYTMSVPFKCCIKHGAKNYWIKLGFAIIGMYFVLGLPEVVFSYIYFFDTNEDDTWPLLCYNISTGVISVAILYMNVLHIQATLNFRKQSQTMMKSLANFQFILALFVIFEITVYVVWSEVIYDLLDYGYMDINAFLFQRMVQDMVFQGCSFIQSVLILAIIISFRKITKILNAGQFKEFMMQQKQNDKAYV